MEPEVIRTAPTKETILEIKKQGRTVVSAISGMLGFCNGCGEEREMIQANEIRIGAKLIIEGKCGTCGAGMTKKERK